MVPVARGDDGFFPFPAPPKLVADEDKLRLWHKVSEVGLCRRLVGECGSPPKWRRPLNPAPPARQLDTTFGQPKTNLIAVVHLDDCYTSARAAVLTDLFVQLATVRRPLPGATPPPPAITLLPPPPSPCAQEGCNEIAYFAEVAGLNFRLQNTVSGMLFRVRGFNHKLPVLVDKVAAAIASLDVDEAAFQRLHQRLADKFKSFAVSQPYMHAFHDTTRTLRVRRSRRQGADTRPLTLRRKPAYPSPSLPPLCSGPGPASTRAGPRRRRSARWAASRSRT